MQQQFISSMQYRFPQVQPSCRCKFGPAQQKKSNPFIKAKPATTKAIDVDDLPVLGMGHSLDPLRMQGNMSCSVSQHNNGSSKAQSAEQ